MKHLHTAVVAGACLLVACSNGGSTAAPQIEITFPVEGSIQRDARIEVAGTAENLNQLEVNGVVAEVVGGEWQALVPFSQGEVEVRAEADGASDAVTFTVDSVHPSLLVSSPQRALYRDKSGGETITVSGSATDGGTGLEIVKVGEQIVRPDASGNWSYDTVLTPGINEFVITARDRAGNETEDVRGVMYGDFRPADDTIDPAFDIWLDDESMPILEEVVEGFVTPENLMVMVGAFESESIEISSIELSPVDATFTLRPGAIGISLVVKDLVVLGKFVVSGDQYDARIEIRSMRVSLDVLPFATEDGQLDVMFSDPVLDLAPEDLSYQVADLSDEDNQFLEDLVIESARSGFGYVLSLGLFDALYDPEILNRKIAVLDREIIFEVAFSQVDVFSDGVAVRTTVKMPAERWPDVRESPGALYREPSARTSYDPTGHVAFSATESVLDRILHGVWHSGLLHYQLDSQAFAGFDLPIELTAGALATALGIGIQEVTSPSTPAALRLRPQFPPIADFDVENRRFLIKVPEAHIDILLQPPGQEPILLATIAAFLDLSVALTITEGVVVRLNFDTQLKADVADEPLVDLDDERTEEFLESVIALIPEVLAAGLDVRGEADITWLTLGNPVVGVHGANNDHATLNLDMTANPQSLEPPEPENP